MPEPLISTSATAPVLGVVLGLLLYFSGSGLLAGIGILMILGSGLLLAIRLFGLVLRLFGTKR